MIHQERISFDGGQSWHLGVSISSITSAPAGCLPFVRLLPALFYYLQHPEEQRDEAAAWIDQRVRIVCVEVKHFTNAGTLPAQKETQVEVADFVFADYNLAGGPNTSVVETGPRYEFHTDGGSFTFGSRCIRSGRRWASHASL